MGFYSWQALDVFNQERLKSEEHAQSRVASSLLAYTRSVIDGKASELRLIAGGFDHQTQQFNSIAQARFQGSPELSFAGVFNKNASGEFVSQAAMERDEGARVKNILLSKLNSKEWRKHGRLTFLPLDEKLAALVLTQTSSNLVVLIFNAEDLLANFNDSTTTRSRLITKFGTTILGPKRDRENFAGAEVLKIVDFAQPELRQLKTTSSNGDKVSMAYAPLAGVDLILVSTTGDKYTGALSRQFAKYSLNFFVLMVCLALLLSLEAARRGRKEVASEIEAKSTYIAASAQRLTQNWIEEVRREEELKTAEFAKNMLYPRKPEADLGSVRVAGFLEAPDEYRADWWHYSEKDGQVLIWIGDTSGHGQNSALAATAAKTVATLTHSLSCFDPATVMGLLNQAVHSVSRTRTTMSFFLARIDKKKGELTYCNASHEPALLAPHLARALHQEDFVWLTDSHGPRLGETAKATYGSTTVPVSEGATLFSYSDGLARTRDTNGATFGDRRLFRLAQRLGNEGAAPTDWVKALREELGEFRKGQPLKDDVTFVVSEYRP